MSPFDSYGFSGVVVGYGAYYVGTNNIINYPYTQFHYSFYRSTITGLGGAKLRLASALEASGIIANSEMYDTAPNSNKAGRGIVTNNFNGARAVEAEAARVASLFGNSIHGPVTYGPGNPILSMTNVNGNARVLDLYTQTRSFWTGATDRFFEVKTGLTDLAGTRGGTTGVQVPSDIANQAARNASARPYRIAGQALRLGGARSGSPGSVTTPTPLTKRLPDNSRPVPLVQCSREPGTRRSTRSRLMDQSVLRRCDRR